jgi:tetraacyldisaccharide 4'-kinase
MKLLRKALFPLSWVYDGLTRLRNTAYTKGWFESESFSIPTIVVGNLSAGGTGKTPMVSYLVELLHKDFKIAALSRGYKRKTSGFQLAHPNVSALELGDESYQLYEKFKNLIVAVDENRPHGIQSLLDTHPDLEGVLLDDAYQHRKLASSFRVLLTTYDQPWFRDCLLPAGNLRESHVGKKRADVVVVTKCPTDLSDDAITQFKEQLQLASHQALYFTSITYDDYLKGTQRKLFSDFVKKEFVLVTGIAQPKPLLMHLDQQGAHYTHLSFADHHHFSFTDLEKITNFNLPILTTEKDYVRLKPHNLKNLYYLPIEQRFLSGKSEFDSLIKSQFHVGRRSQNQ